MSDDSTHSTHALSDADCIDLLIRHRTNPDVTYDDLAYMAGWIYDATVSPEDLAAIDAGDLRPEISEQLEAILRGEESSVSRSGESSDQVEKNAEDKSPREAESQEASEDDLHEQYEKYKARQQRWYSEQEQLSFDEFVRALWRWENEYGEAWNLEAPDQSDRETLDELEGLLCAPPQSRIFSALITTEASKQAPEDAFEDGSTNDESTESELDSAGREAIASEAPVEPSETVEPDETEAREVEPLEMMTAETEPAETEPAEVNSAEGEGPEVAEAAVDPLEEPEPAPESPSPHSTDADSDETSVTSSSEKPELEEAPAELTEAPSPSTQFNPEPTMPEGKNLVTELRARRNALDSSMAAIRESLKRYEHMREVLDKAISLLDDDSYEQMLRLAKQFRDIGAGKASDESLSGDASDGEQSDDAVPSGDGRSSQQRPFRVTTG